MEINKIIFIGLFIFSSTGAVPGGLLVEPFIQEIREGEPFHFRCSVTPTPLKSCQFLLPSNELLTLDPNNRTPSTSGVHYFGHGLEKGDCGIHVDAAQPKHAGEYSCMMDIEGYGLRNSKMNLTKVKAPLPELSFTGGNHQFIEDETLQLEATCRVKIFYQSSTPQFKWLLEDEVLMEDASSRSPKFASSTLKRALKWKDHGKRLRCEVRHHQGADWEVVGENLHVKFGPKPESNSVLINLQNISEPGYIHVEFHANPEPEVTWVNFQGQQGQIVLKTGERNSEYEVPGLQKIGPGLWRAQLIISKVSERDFANWTLIASNEMGSQTYQVFDE